jgi:signal transduction histidine kinase/ActR/RegA family two-component response regulator
MTTMTNPLAWLFDSGSYMPHGHCYLWQPGVLWLHVVADALIAASYLAIPAILYYFVKRRRHEIPYWWMPVLFGSFILLCGTTHALGIWTIWNPDYRLDGAVKIVTGVVSAGTAVSLAWLMPQVLLLQTPAQLQRVVDERTGELEALTRQLREAIEAQKCTEQALIEADRRKDEFLATLAHELRNPLAPIRYALRLLEPGTPDETAADARQMINRQLAQMARLLDDLLDVSRITRGRLELRREVLDLRTLVSQAADTARPLIEALRHELRVRLPPQPVPVSGDATRLAQIIGNLLNNAAKYTEPGGHLEVGVELHDGVVRVTVQDDGTGLEPDEMATIFELFARADSGKRMQAGLGIGLSLSRQLAERHGGELAVSSAGRSLGSTFTLTLPRAVEAPAVAPGVPATSVVIPLPGRQPRVLIVDDNVDAADALSQMLSLSGYLTRSCNDGRAATEVAELMRPDIVLLDIGLPSLSGHEVARWIRSQPWGVTTRLVAITGWGQERDRQRGREAGFDEHLTKPVDPDQLLQLLATLGAPRSATA